jgi:hypothetical protein
MFWGCVISEGKPYALPEDSEYELLHISNASLSKASEPGKVYISIAMDKETFTVGSLQKDKIENLFLDLYVRSSQKIKIMASGKGEVHITGYLEPAEAKFLDEDDILEGAIPGEESEEESEEEEEVPKPKAMPVKVAKKEEKKEAKKIVEVKKPVEQKKPMETKKIEQLGGKIEEEDESEDDLEMGESSESEEEKPKKGLLPKKREAEKPLVQPGEIKKAKIEAKPGEAKKPKIEQKPGKPVEQGKQPIPQGEGKKKKKKNKPMQK